MYYMGINRNECIVSQIIDAGIMNFAHAIVRAIQSNSRSIIFCTSASRRLGARRDPTVRLDDEHARAVSWCLGALVVQSNYDAIHAII